MAAKGQRPMVVAMSNLKQFLLIASAVATGVLVGLGVAAVVVVVAVKVGAQHFGIKVPF